jgi:molybdate transport system substrate-binding protein
MFWNRIPVFVLIIAAVFTASAFSASGPEGKEILVSAAISLKSAFEEIGQIYEKKTGVRVRFNLGASGLLQKQIESGAPVDMFASAGEKQMDALQTKGLIFADTRRDFARNELVLVIPGKAKLPIRSFADLVRPEVTRIAIGNPKTVPAGQYAQEALNNLKLWNRVQSRLVLAENVRQVLDYVVRGETEAGIVYASDVSSVHGMTKITARAPKDSHSPILYPIAIIKETRVRSEAQRFIDLTLGKEGQAILAKYGFPGLK